MTDDLNPTDDNHIEEGESLVRPLPEDNDTPFNRPTDPIEDPAAELEERTQEDYLDPTHPDTDTATDIDSQQLYDGGLADAAESGERKDDSVVGYNPDKDQRRDDTSTTV